MRGRPLRRGFAFGMLRRKITLTVMLSLPGKIRMRSLIEIAALTAASAPAVCLVYIRNVSPAQHQSGH